MDGYKKHKCIYCNYTSDQTNNVKRHVMKKRPESSPSPIDGVSEKIEDQTTMGMDEQLINPMGKHIKNKPKPIGEGTGKWKIVLH